MSMVDIVYLQVSRNKSFHYQSFEYMEFFMPRYLINGIAFEKLDFLHKIYWFQIT